MADNSKRRDKPWRPGDYPPLGPSWDQADPTENAEPQGVPDAED